MLRSKKTLVLVLSLLVFIGIFSRLTSYSISKSMILPNNTLTAEDAHFWGVPISKEYEDSKKSSEYNPSNDYSFWGIPRELQKIIK